MYYVIMHRYIHRLICKSRDTSVGIATGLQAGKPGFRSQKGHVFSILQNVQIGSGVHQACYQKGTGGKVAGA
jgi:hypothetical protein